MDHTVTATLLLADEKGYEGTTLLDKNSVWRPVSSTSLLGIPHQSVGIIGRQPATLLRVSRRQEIIL